MDGRLSPTPSSWTKKLAAAGFILGAGGGAWFYLSPGGTSSATMGSFAIMGAGIGMFLVALHFGNWEQARARFSSALQPGSGWSLAAKDELRGECEGLSVRVWLRRSRYDKAGREVAPPRTTVRFALPDAAAVKVVLRRDTPWWGTDIGDLWAQLSVLESVSIDPLKAYGSPPQEAEELVSCWLRQGFDRWRKAVPGKLKISLAWVRLDGNALELCFEGLLTEPFRDEKPSLQGQLDELLRGCLSWHARS